MSDDYHQVVMAWENSSTVPGDIPKIRLEKVRTKLFEHGTPDPGLLEAINQQIIHIEASFDVV